MGRPAAGFSYRAEDAQTVIVSRDGREVVTLRGYAAARFLADVTAADPQAVMARATGNYRRGNERVASHHPRNRR